MVIKEIMITRGRKYTRDFQSVSYNVGLTFDIDEDNKDFDLVRQQIIKALQKLVIAEEIRCRDTMLLQDYENGKKPEATSSGHPVEKLVVTEEKIETTNSPMTYFKDLKNCTIMAESESGMAYQVIKDGFYTWLAKSHIDESVMPLSMGILLQDIPLKDTRKWILGKDKGGNPKLEWKVVGS